MFSPLNGPCPHVRVQIELIGVVGVGRVEEFLERREGAAPQEIQEVRELEQSVPEDVERVEEPESLEVCAERKRVPVREIREVVGELPRVRAQDVVNGERLLTHGCVGDAALADLQRREVHAERCAMVAIPVVAGEEAVGEVAGAAVQLQGEGVDVVVDGVPCVLERQTGLVGAAAGVIEAEHERVRRQVPAGIQVVVSKRQHVARIDVPVELREDLVVVGLVGVALVRPGIIPIHVEHPLPDGIHRGRVHPADAQPGGAARARREIAARVVGPLQLGVDEEEEFVLDHRAAEGEPRLDEAFDPGWPPQAVR